MVSILATRISLCHRDQRWIPTCDADKVFLTPNRDVVAVDSGDVVYLSFADSLLRDGRDIKRRHIAASEYRCTEHVTSTSNVCQLLFSAARLIMNHLRGHIDPDSCEILLFLKINSRFGKIHKYLIQSSQTKRKQQFTVFMWTVMMMSWCSHVVYIMWMR